MTKRSLIFNQNIQAEKKLSPCAVSGLVLYDALAALAVLATTMLALLHYSVYIHRVHTVMQKQQECLLEISQQMEYCWAQQLCVNCPMHASRFITLEDCYVPCTYYDGPVVNNKEHHFVWKKITIVWPRLAGQQQRTLVAGYAYNN